MDVDLTDRATGKLIAFETNEHYTYAAADLTRAYPEKVVRSMRREILFLTQGVVIVLDRVSAVKPRTKITWHLQFPARPRIDGEELTEATQLHGVDAKAGIWQLGPSQDWLDVVEQEGRLFVRTLLPAVSDRYVLGGPMETDSIQEGTAAKRIYHGGHPDGYEHRLWPASFLRAPNAAFVLGAPLGIGPHLGLGATWGRLDVEAAEHVGDVTFLHVLAPTDRINRHPPDLEFTHDEETAHLKIELPARRVEIDLNLGQVTGGHVVIRDDALQFLIFEQDLAAGVQPTMPLPVLGTP
jgi:hypothetical protein